MRLVCNPVTHPVAIHQVDGGRDPYECGDTGKAKGEPGGEYDQCSY